MNSRVFSLPINPKLDEKTVNEVLIPFLLEYKDYIFDLYFTCRMPPFMQDAMGDIFSNPQQLTGNSLYISQQTGIPLSATFNNIHVPPTQENLDIFIENYKPVYNAGVKIATIPHTSWVMTGQIQNAFPELYIKNTILREVRQANEIVSLAKAGFNYINLDRDLMRDRDQLVAIKEAKEYCASIGKPVKISLLANENCWGGCPIMPEHYQYNSNRDENHVEFFGDAISRISCSRWEHEDTSASLKAANLPPWKTDWEEFIDLGIDVFKMHGRESAMRLSESMDIIKRWADNEELLFPTFNSYIEDVSLQDRPIDIWRDKIKTCKFDCWKCNYCESVVESRLRKQHRQIHPYVSHVIKSIDKSSQNVSNFDSITYDIVGLSSDRVRHLLNNLCQVYNPVYLEVGVYNGSTFFAALQNNSAKAYAVDHYELPDIRPYRDDIEWIQSEDPLQDFIDNSSKYMGQNSVKFIQKHCKDLTSEDFHPLYSPNVVFYDGEHSHQEQLESLNTILPHLQDTFILVIDDANMDDAVISTNDFIDINNLEVLFEKKILHQIEDSSLWWNGLYILVISKNK